MLESSKDLFALPEAGLTEILNGIYGRKRVAASFDLNLLQLQGLCTQSHKQRIQRRTECIS